MLNMVPCLYLLCSDGYVICHDDNVNRFLNLFNKLPPEIMEYILVLMSGCDGIHINKFFATVGVNLLYPTNI